MFKIAIQSGLLLDPLFELWNSAVNLLPGLVAALIILIIGYFLGMIIGHAVRIVLQKLKLDEKVKKAKLVKAVGHTHLSALFGELIKWFIFIIFLQQGVALLKLGILSDLLNEFVLWLPNVIAAIVIILFSLGLAHFVEMKMREHSNMKWMNFLSRLIKVVIVIMAVIISLGQIGIEVSVLENTFLLIVGAFAIGIAAAIGIGLGLGMKSQAQNIVNKWFKNF